MRIRSMIRLFVVACLATFLTGPATPGIAAQGTPDAAGENPFDDLGLPHLDITITDTAFEGVPAELDAGRYSIAVTATTSEPFPVGGVFMQMPEGLTTEAFVDFVATAPDFSAGPPRPQPWYYEAVVAGGPYVVPGETRYAVVELTAGDWVFTAEYRVAPQAPVPVTVSGELPEDLPTPAADLTIEMSEFAFSYSDPLRSGLQIVEITNAGDQRHHYSLGAWPDGTTTEDLQAFIEADFAAFSGVAATPVTTGPLAGVSITDIEEVFGTAEQSAGVTAWYAIELEPGTYGALCFERDPESDTPHAVLGQVEVSVVE